MNDEHIKDHSQQQLVIQILRKQKKQLDSIDMIKTIVRHYDQAGRPYGAYSPSYDSCTQFLIKSIQFGHNIVTEYLLTNHESEVELETNDLKNILNSVAPKYQQLPQNSFNQVVSSLIFCVSTIDETKTKEFLINRYIGNVSQALKLAAEHNNKEAFKKILDTKITLNYKDSKVIMNLDILLKNTIESDKEIITNFLYKHFFSRTTKKLLTLCKIENLSFNSNSFPTKLFYPLRHNILPKILSFLTNDHFKNKIRPFPKKNSEVKDFLQLLKF